MFLDSGFVDGKVETSPAQAIKYDRRLESIGSLGFEVARSRFGLRVNAKADYVRRRVADAETPRTIEDQEFTTFLPSAELTFVTDKGLEIFVGQEIRYTPAYRRRTDTPVADTETRYGLALLRSKRFGILRRSAGWSAGLYHVTGDDATRSYETIASDGSQQVGMEAIFEPPQFGIIAEISGILMSFESEIEMIQARGKGPRDENNHTAFTDYFTLRSDAVLKLSELTRIKLGAAHQTMAYSNNANINLDTIAVSTVRASLLLGDLVHHTLLGVSHSLGDDGQSLPEFNADFRFRSYAWSLGLFLTL